MKAIRPSSKFSPPPNLVAGYGLLTSSRCLCEIRFKFLGLLILKGGANLSRFGAEGVSYGLEAHWMDVNSDLPAGLDRLIGPSASTGVNLSRNRVLLSDKSLD